MEQQRTQSRTDWGNHGELGQGKTTEDEPSAGVGVKGRMVGCLKHEGKGRTAGLDWHRQRHTFCAVWGIKD